MRKAFSYLLLLACLAMTGITMRAANIWTGNQAINWNNSQFVSIDATKFSDAQVADIISFSIEFTGNTDWPQISLTRGDWAGGLAGSGNTAVSSQTPTIDYYITSDMLAELQQYGLVVAGIGFNLTAVDVKAGAGSAGYENAVWIGNTVLPADWSGAVTLPKSCFNRAAAGKLIRVKYKDLQPGAIAILRTGDWKEMPDMPDFRQLSGNHTDIKITASMLTQLKDNGCILQGVGATITSVDIIDEEDLSKLQLSVPITNNWVWNSPDVPVFTLNVTNPTMQNVNFGIQLLITDDKHTAHYDRDFGTNAIGAGETNTYSLTPDVTLAPGFYEATIMANDEVARKFIFGVNPEQIVSAPDKQADFDTFWATAKTELAATDGQYTLTEIPSKSTSRRKVYLLEMRSVGDGTGEGIVRAYYAEPTGNGNYPALIHYQGYDGGGTDTPWCMGGDDTPDYCEIIVSTRGQVINNRPPYTNAYGDWFVYGFGNKDTYYYRGAYMDCVRAIDFLCSREKVQRQNIFAEGASQGGAFTLAAAALSDGRLNAIAPAIPFMGDFPDYFQVANWPANTAIAKKNQLGMSDDDMYSMLSYFDTKNLATMISCPVYMTYSLQDDVCPPHTNWAPYNNLVSTEKIYLTNPTLGHATSNAWWNIYHQFFTDHLKSADAITTTTTADTTDTAVYNIQGIRMNGTLSTLPKGIYIQSGRKIVK